MVQCAECADAYDSDDNAFCPRCGATATADTPAKAAAMARRDEPSRRRVQAAGVMMSATGGLLLLLGVIVLFAAGPAANAVFTDGAPQMSSPLAVQVLDNGTAVAGASVMFQVIGGGNETVATDADGWANVSARDGAVVEVSLPGADGPAALRILAINLASEGPVVITYDHATDAFDHAAMGRDAVAKMGRVFGGVAIALALPSVLGGMAAVRLRNLSTATLGAAMGLLPWLFVAMANLVGVVMVALFVTALVFIRQGRAHFT